MVGLNIDIPDSFYEEELRDGFMVSKEMKEIWAVELDLLFELRRVCNKYGLQIYADTGAFVEITDPLLLELGTGLKRGDILLMEGHTAVAIDSDDHHDTFPVLISNCSKSRIRSGPGMNYETIEIISNGDILEAEGTATDEDGFPWYRVHADEDMIGYTSSAYATPLPQGRCTADTWLRAEAGTKGKQIIVIPKGAKPYLTGKAQKVSLRVWYECIYGGHRGWASSLNIKP